MRRDFRLAVAQTPGELDGTAARLDWLRAALPEIAAEGADLLLTPELFACGYNIGDAVRARAETADGPTFAAIAALAREHDLAISYGFAERAGGALHNAALCVGPDGAALSLQRKLALPPGPERGVFTAGRGLRPFAWRGLKIATLICYDAEFPETVRAAAAMGAELVLAPTALVAAWPWIAHSLMPTRAYENGVYLAYANSAGEENGMTYLGASVIAAPDGVEIARADARPAILYADIDRARVTAAQARLPYLEDRFKLDLDPGGR